MKCIWDSSQSTRAYVDGMGSHLNLSGYSRIGLQAQVATYLGEYDTVLGNYGLAMQLYFKVPNLVDGENTFSKFVNFDSSEFFGNIYRFDSYRTQEVVYDLSEYQNFVLDRIKLFIYQRVNFKDKNGNMIEAPQDEYSGHNIAPNISFKDFYICTGIPAEGFESDTVELICNNNNDYYKDIQPLSMPILAGDQNYIDLKECFNSAIKLNMLNLKDGATLSASDIKSIILNSTDPSNIYDALIQIVKIDAPSSVMTPEEKAAYISKYNLTDTQYNILKNVYPAFPSLVNYIGSMIGRETYNQKDVEAIWLHKDESLGTIARVEEGALPLNYTIRWYRHDIGAQSPDPWAGAHWRRFYGCREEPDDKLDYCITEQELSNAKLTNEDIDIATDHVRVIFKPNVNNSEEQLKAILLYNEFNDSGEVIAQRFIAASKPIIFYNKDDVRSQATIIDLNTLAIRIEDEERGKYFLYNRADDLPETEANEIRVLTAVFDPDEPDVYKKAPLSDFTSIEWTFPVDNTMITPATDSTPGAVKASTNVFTGVISVGYFINPHLDRYATNNTVQLKVIKDGLSWEAECQFVFGTAGTSGSDYTLVLNWRNINKVLDVTYPGWDSLKGEVGLQDRTGKYITIPTGSELQYDWLVSEIPAQNPEDSNYDFVTEDLDLYYPIFDSSTKAIFERSENGDLYSNYRNSNEKTYGGYYYYLDNNYENLLTALSKASGKHFYYNNADGFTASGTSSISTDVDDIAFFDLNKKKFIKITDGSIGNIDTPGDGSVNFSYTSPGSTNIRVKQFYRKRRNKISLTDKSVVNQNEVFFQNIYKDKYSDEDVYENLLDNINLWPTKEDGETLNIQSQDNILNLGKLQVDKDDNTYSIGEDLVNFLNEEHGNFKNDLKLWINNAKYQSYKRNNKILTSEELEEINVNKMLVELIFNLKNIYEYTLNKMQSSLDLSSLSLNLKYYFYDEDSKQFIHISQYPNSKKSDLFNNKVIFYNLNENINNSDLLQYEFPKPKLEYKPLTLLNTTNKFSQQEDPYQNDSRNKVFDINLKVVRNSDLNYIQTLRNLFFGDTDLNIDFLTMFNSFKDKNNKFKQRSQVGRPFKERSFWQGKAESLLNDYFAIREYYFYLLSAGQEEWSYDYSTDDNPLTLTESQFKLAFCQEFLDNEALAAANFPERISMQGQRVDDNKFQSLIYTRLLYEDDINNTYRNIDNELLANNSNLKKYYKENLSKLTDDRFFYILKDYPLEEGQPNWWQSIYKILCQTINFENNFSLNDFINNYFYTTGNDIYRLKLKQRENLSEEKGIWLDGDGINYITNKLRDTDSICNLVDFYNDYLKDDSSATVKFLTGVDGTEDLLETFLEDYFILLTNIFDANTDGLNNKIKGLLLNETISATGVTDQAKNYNLLKTPSHVIVSNECQNYLIRTGRFDFPYEQLNQYLSQSLNKYNIDTKTPLSDTFKLYQDLYNTLNNIKYYENFEPNSYWGYSFFTFLNSNILFDATNVSSNNYHVKFSGLDQIAENYLNEFIECMGAGTSIALIESNYLKIYEDSSKYKIEIPQYSFILKEGGALKNYIDETIDAYCTSQGYMLKKDYPDAGTQRYERSYEFASISNFINDRNQEIFPNTTSMSINNFMQRLIDTKIKKIKVIFNIYTRNEYVGVNEDNQRLWDWVYTTATEAIIDLNNFDSAFLQSREDDNTITTYYWFDEDWADSTPIQLQLNSTGVTKDLNFNTFIELLTGGYLPSQAEMSQLFLWMRCLKDFENNGYYHWWQDIKIRLDADYFLKKIITDEETGLTSEAYYYLNDDFSKYINLDSSDWSAENKRKELAKLILDKYLYAGVTRVDTDNQDFYLFSFNNITKTPYSCYSCDYNTISSNKLEEILYRLLLKNPQNTLSYTEISRFLYTNSSLFWKYFSYKKWDYYDLGREFHSITEEDNPYSPWDKYEYDSYSKIEPIHDNDWGLVTNYYYLDNTRFQQYTIADTIFSQYLYHIPHLSYSVTHTPEWPDLEGWENETRIIEQLENHIVYYIAIHLEDLRKQAIVSNIVPIVPSGEFYEGLTGEALKEYQLSRIELQDKAFTSQSFSFISKFYNNLNQYIQVATQTLNRSDKENFLRFKIDMYEFLSNQELESRTESFVNGKLREYFEENPMPYLIEISNLNAGNENKSIFTINNDTSYDIALVNTTAEDGKLYLYNLSKLIKNISSEDWLYKLLSLLKINQVKINPAGTQKSWSKVYYLYHVTDYKTIITSYFIKELESSTADKVAELESLMNDYYLNSSNPILKVWGKDHRPSNAFSSDYKILYNDKIYNLSEIFGNDYLTVNKLEDKYNNVFMKNTIYIGDVSSDGTDTKHFNYYNAGHHKAFINIDGQYVLDPYGDWIEEETYYEPIQVKEYACKIPPLKFIASKVNKNDSTNTFIEIYPRIGLSADVLMKSLSILKVTLTKFGNHDLVAYFPIPLRNGTEVTENGQVKFEAKYIDGAAEVRYTSGGTTEYNKNPYRIFVREFNENEGNKIREYEPNISQSTDRTGINDIPGWNWGILIPSDQKYGIETANFVPHIVKRLLEPSPVYIPNLKAYAVQYYDTNNGIFLWNQPILSYEDNYPSTTLNGWNGEEILTDKDTGTIVASAFAAGKKERDNTFTGLMLGDWSRSDTDKYISKQTGIYGFYHGSMAYAFKDDGTGFIGRDGRGRIYFNGQNSTIYSSEWIGNEPLGMLLDLDDGVIQLNSKAYNTTLSSLYTSIVGQTASITVLGNTITATVSSASQEDLGDNETYKYITISAEEDHYPLAIGTTSILSQRKFKVAWDGTTYIEDGVFSGILHAKGGILDNNFIVNGTLYGGTLLGGTLYASALYANYGQIGPWKITPAGLVNSDNSTVLIGSTPDIVLTSESGEQFTMEGANNPYASSIITNRIFLSTTGVIVGEDGSVETSEITGALGYIQGGTYSNNLYTPTQGIGLSSDGMITISSMQGDIGIKAGVQLHLEGGSGSGGAPAYIQVNHSANPAIGSNGIVLHGTGVQFWQIPAENQYGIYARFA